MSERHFPGEKNKGQVIWITGLSGAGKTTLARAIMPFLPAAALLLDGDELREALGAAHGHFEPEGRRRLAFTYARLAGLLARQGAVVVVATISLFHELHAWNREHLPRYVEVFLDVPEGVRRERDPKGLYAGRTSKAPESENASPLAGVDYAAETPLNPTLRFDHTMSLDAMRAAVLETAQRLREA